LPPSGDRSKAVMVTVIVSVLLGENHWLRDRQAVKVISRRLKTIPFRVRFARTVGLCKLKIHLIRHRDSSAAGGPADVRLIQAD
jgi:hypothetical protein